MIHHCAVCKSPCCRLDTHVLELEWQQVKVFWQLAESRQQFDKRLAAGKGPEEIRAAGGRYFAHRKPCPAYDEAGHSCRVYDQAIKPAGCSDYPVYGDGDCLIADLRCEDLWQLLDDQVRRHKLEWIWVKGHAGHPENERADALANRGIDEQASRNSA